MLHSSSSSTSSSSTVEWYRSDHLVQIHVRVHGMAHDRENLVLVPNCAVCVGGCM